jgi:hypothetical protein
MLRSSGTASRAVTNNILTSLLIDFKIVYSSSPLMPGIVKSEITKSLNH